MAAIKVTVMTSSSVMTSSTLIKPITRKQTEIRLIDHISLILSDAKYWRYMINLPHSFFTTSNPQDKAISVVSHSTTNDVFDVWAKVRLPARLKKHVVDKIESLFRK